MCKACAKAAKAAIDDHLPRRVVWTEIEIPDGVVRADDYRLLYAVAKEMAEAIELSDYSRQWSARCCFRGIADE
jgi:hypothetical protein